MDTIVDTAPIIRKPQVGEVYRSETLSGGTTFVVLIEETDECWGVIHSITDKNYINYVSELPKSAHLTNEKADNGGKTPSGIRESIAHAQQIALQLKKPRKKRIP